MPRWCVGYILELCDEICPEKEERAESRLQCLSNERDRLLAGCHKQY